MTQSNQFGTAKPGSFDCAACEAMLADMLDGTLDAADQARFDLHAAGCAECRQMLADAQRGAAWLEMLRDPRPEPPAALLERILMQTSGIHPATDLRPVEVPHTAKILPFPSRIAAHLRSLGQTMLEPRLAMTAAMAFFSVGLTLNLTGIRLNQLKPADLKPSSIRRSFYQANARAVRYVDNMRTVYELESRVRDLQSVIGDDTTPNLPHPVTPNPTPDGNEPASPRNEQKRTAPPNGTSLRTLPFDPRRATHLLQPVTETSRGGTLHEGGLL